MEQPASAPTEETNTARDVQSPPSGDIAQLRKVTLSSLLGTTIEYYDFLLYSTMAALVFGDLFFPSSNSARRG